MEVDVAIRTVTVEVEQVEETIVHEMGYGYFVLAAYPAETHAQTKFMGSLTTRVTLLLQKVTK